MKKDTLVNPWFFEENDLYQKLHTSHSGLDTVVVTDRQQEYGTNEIAQNHKATLLQIILDQFTSPLIFILILAAMLTGFLNEWVDMSVIIFAILINTGLGFYQEYQAENTLATLTTYIKNRTRVVRSSREIEIDAKDLVPGDIIVFSYGNRIAADARIIESTNLKIDEAILTGESQAVNKKPGIISESALVAERTNMAHAGTLVVEGFGKAIVTSIGKNTEIGKIAELVSKTQHVKTPLQHGVTKLSWFIFFVILIIIGGIFALGISQGVPVLEMLVLSAAVAVGTVPEALPIALTVILSVGATFIARKKGIIRKLASAETLGSATLIMTDKTGTLTEANMKLVGIFSLKSLLNNIKGISGSTINELEPLQYELIAQSLYNINVAVTDQEGVSVFEGKPFEKNIAQLAYDHKIDIAPLISDANHLIIPFNSTHKFSVAHYNDTYYSIMGAPDILIARSNLSEQDKKQCESWIADMSESGNRLIAVAKMPRKNNDDLHIDDISAIEFLGVFAFHDPIRAGVPQAISDIESRGVRVVMITGDLPGTALSVGKSLGWNVDQTHIITGNDIRSSTDQALLEIIPQIKIFARVTPEDKLRIGGLYQQLGEVVAMTGDGVNDAPALKAMDIGISLGSASDVAKSAASLVLLDDNFETITASITEGRRILANIQKTFMYLLSNSLDAVFIIAGSFLFGLPLPLTALQIIWVNMFTGSLPAIAFAFDEDLDHEKRPKKYRKEIFTTEVKQVALGIGTLSSVFLFVLYVLLLKTEIPLEIIRSIFFVCFTIYILVIAFSFRAIHRPIWSYNPFSNKRLNASILLALALTTITVTVPWVQSIFGLTAFPIKYLGIIFGWVILNIILVEGAKWWIRRRVN